MCRLTILAAILSVAIIACGGGGGASSPDNPIIFVAPGNEDRSDIFAVDPATAEITNLTDNPAHDFAAALSPDGSKIAFFSTRDREDPDARDIPALYVMDVNGSSVEVITGTKWLIGGGDERIAWHPNGDRLLFTEAPGQPVIADLDGVVHRPEVFALSSVWSRGGQRIIYTAGDEEATEVSYWAVDPYTLERERLFPLAISDDTPGRPCEQPDLDGPPGQWLLYGSGFDYQSAARVKDGTGQVLYAHDECDLGVRHSQIATRDPAFQNERVLTDDPSSKYGARWSPDGARIAYMAQTAEAPSVWTMNADGSNQTLIATDAGQPVWSPSGSAVAYVGTTNPGSYRRDEFAIFVANADGLGGGVLVDGVGWVSELVWSATD